MRAFFIFFCLSFSLSVAGCTSSYNLATDRQETSLYSTDKEVDMGYNYSRQVEKIYHIIQDVDINERVERILNRIVKVCDRNDIVYFIKVIEDKKEKDIINAVSLPGGYVYIFKGLLDKIKNDDQLAGVIAHEIGHITARHGMKRLQASYGALLLQLASIQTDSNVAQGVNLAIAALFTQYSQNDEFQADALSVKYLKKAGFDPEGVRSVLEMLRQEEEKSPTRPMSYWRTHPFLAQRIANVRKEISGQLEFRDYLNLTQPQGF
ncbi:MAG TPA: M48 family metallopeptidase [Candidatus Omnitrophota bacterium]|nr:M48 family metallopeptidase [Candidatus Omnitrophota bacterium]